MAKGVRLKRRYRTIDQPPLDSNQLAQERTDWALGRTVMALERTLMAWLRTAVSLISFGFTIFKILQALLQKGSVAMRPEAPRNLGLLLILLGMAMLVVGAVEYLNVRKNLLAKSEKKVPFSMTLAACVGVFFIGLFTVLNILFGLGGF